MLHVNSVTKSYDSSVPTLSDVSLTVHPKEILFLLGPSGVGKSTLLRVIANLDLLDSGTITLDDRTAEQIGFAQWRRDISYVSQNRPGVKGTPVELLRKALSFSSRSSAKLDIEYYIEEYINISTKVGLSKDNLYSQNWSELSGGQAQRAYVALCVVLQPKLLLLDEPTSSCDQKSTMMIEKLITESQIAAIWVSHDQEQSNRVPGRKFYLTNAV